MLDFPRSLTFASALTYAGWRAMGRRAPVMLKTRLGSRFELRPLQPGIGGNNDYGVAYEIFVHEFYKPAGRLAAADIRLVVDLGANVGYSILYWLRQFPNCRVIAFEAHPLHAGQAARNLQLNGIADRVELHDAAAGAKTQAAVVTDAGSSTIVSDSGSGTTIRVVDVFPLLMGHRIDLLKIDIEGGEYDILDDARFAGLDVQAIVMEWHARPGYDHAWVHSKLTQLGFRVEDLFVEPSHGMLWALRRAEPANP
jgi:FkbM family methyltransferase